MRKAPVSARLLDAIEHIGNRLPHPATLFVIFAVLVVIASAIAAQLGISVTHPKDGSLILPVNLLEREQLRRMFTDAPRNFTGFAPLGTVLVTMLGIGVAEGSGLVSAALRALVTRVPRSLLTATVVFAGIAAHTAADAGIIVLPPLAALVFIAFGRHPLAGVAAAFAGVAGGFSASLLPVPLDVLLAGLTQEAVDASRMLPGYRVQLLGNYWFMAAATPLLAVVGTWITSRIVEPRLGVWSGETHGAPVTTPTADAAERRGLRAAGVAALATFATIAMLAAAPWSPLRIEGATTLDRMKPFFDSIVTLVMLVTLIPGLAFGIAAGRIRSDHDVARMMSDSMGQMATYIVLAFTAAQFVNWFAWSNLGAIIAISGAEQLRSWGLTRAPLLTSFVMFSAVLDVFIASASAKWAILAPVFVPMFTLLGFTPEATQVVYRIGDSVTNVVTPLMPYMPFVLATVQRYSPRAGTGTVIAMMLPYALAFLVFWTALLLLFYGMHWPIGPGVGMRLAG
ncbi:MAG: AbgT family transporter [Candidatus Eisenbacteria bacterium]|uniref:AbgT family transporter n=1 Tax=Eiseniibacteriota bacterium TaxID=2212470 RepID=A0A849SQX4_UNCEI|nr:AbgT family transporter [Candidatus Eisenbacteria bacterium]